MTAARDIKSLNNQLESVSEHKIVFRRTCLPDFDPEGDLEKMPSKTPQLFQYDFVPGLSFPEPRSLPRPFIVLKAAIKAHLMGGGPQKEEKVRKDTNTELRV